MHFHVFPPWFVKTTRMDIFCMTRWHVWSPYYGHRNILRIAMNRIISIRTYYVVNIMIVPSGEKNWNATRRYVFIRPHPWIEVTEQTLTKQEPQCTPRETASVRSEIHNVQTDRIWCSDCMQQNVPPLH